MNKSGLVKRLLGGFLLVLLLAILAMGIFLWIFFDLRGHGNITYEVLKATQSNQTLENPNRGFYDVHGFWILDETMDFSQEVDKRLSKNPSLSLAMIQINLQSFRDTEISEVGLSNISALFEELGKVDKNYIIRFLYDWDGKNLETEPDHMEIILRHMEQLAPILNENKDQIYLLQGLFIGNWGEMNGTKYGNAKDVRTLAEKLAAVTDEEIFLSVRMPMFWRQITGIGDVSSKNWDTQGFSARLGLYNDGMMGNETDYGTYGVEEGQEDVTFWSRDEELDFQELLCEKVPNGGEVIVDNPYNDWENALLNLKTMHISYLNWDYDQSVLEKWSQSFTTEEGCYQGMDGLSYVNLHLGYRLYIEEVRFSYDFWEDKIVTEIDFKNRGFAPLYQDTSLILYAKNLATGEWREYALEGDLKTLSGGNSSEEIETVSCGISLAKESSAQWECYVKVLDTVSGRQIYLANEGDATEHGYFIGTWQIETVEQLWEN